MLFLDPLVSPPQETQDYSHDDDKNTKQADNKELSDCALVIRRHNLDVFLLN